MADITNLSAFLKDIADAIREKTGTEEQILAKNFDTEIKNIPTSSYSGVKLFDTIENMNNDADAKEDDLALVYGNEIQHITSDTETQFLVFPEKVVLPNIVSSSSSGNLGPVNNDMISYSIQLTASSFTFYGRNFNIEYTSSDGITYTRTTFNEGTSELTNPVDLHYVTKYQGDWDNNFGYFMQSNVNIFNGLYQYKYVSDSNYVTSYSNISYSSNISYIQDVVYVKDFIDYIRNVILKELSISYYSGIIIKKDNHYIGYSSVYNQNVLSAVPDLFIGDKLYVLNTNTGSSIPGKLEVDIENNTHTLSNIDNIGNIEGFNYIAELNSNDVIFAMDIRDNRLHYERIDVYNNSTDYDTLSMGIGYLNKYVMAPNQLTALPENLYNSIAYGKKRSD